MQRLPPVRTGTGCWVPRACCRQPRGQLVFAFGGSVIGRIVKSPALLAASHVVAALVVLAYGVAGLARL